ncbi:serine/threonine-protein kinase [Streptomyces sp. NPDC048506]|uniref:serine/threonine-protein kinase n=1 Tax=Streptomyces sp. NPDC048506 TaxID=3155028 RepID=UPI0034357092
MAQVPAQIGRYTVERELGSGGMGQVFLAYSPGGDPVAVKLIRSDRLDPATRARFEKEALIARTVVGTNRVARFLDADPYAERPWLAVEYVPGRTVQEHVAGNGPLPAPLVASLGALLAEGLAAVHAVGLLHRDLKPQNVMLGRYGPILIDFGLGAFLDTTKDTLSHSGMIIGTVRCMPPEQALGQKKVKEPADVYGLGTILLYAATGHYPYDGARWEAIATQVTSRQQLPDLSGLPASLIPLVTKMLAHDPADRPALSEVTRQCVAILGEVGLSPANARHALIDVTTASDGGTDTRPVPDGAPSSSLWERIARLAEPLDSDEDEQASPLDRTPETDETTGAAQQAPPGPPVADEPVVPPPVAGEGSTAATPEPSATIPRVGRRPASWVVAENLRSRYATHAAL